MPASTATVQVPEISPRSNPQGVGRAWLPRVVWLATGFNLALIFSVLILLFTISERWWVGTLLTYLPRAPWAVPAVALIVCGLIWHRPSLWLNLVALLLVLGPLMEWKSNFVPSKLAPSSEPTITSTSTPDQTAGAGLRVVSANVQIYKPDFPGLLAEIQQQRPDVVLLQEAFGDAPLLTRMFPDWHRLHVDRYWIGSRFPLKLLGTLDSEVFERTCGIVVEAETPHGPVVFANVHQMTARKGLLDITPGGLLRGEAQSQIESFVELRLAESHEIRTALDQLSSDQPLVVAGDFNTPTSSHIFQETWGDLQSAFDLRGLGYGYTSPVKPHRFWFSYVPWARIDHILCSPQFRVAHVAVGTGRGSDHHLMTAELVLHKNSESRVP